MMMSWRRTTIRPRGECSSKKKSWRKSRGMGGPADGSSSKRPHPRVIPRCPICLRRRCRDRLLCGRCARTWTWDRSMHYFRRKLRGAPPIRWKTQRRLTSVLREIHGEDAVHSEVCPPWACSPKGALLRYDIAIPALRILVEYHGPQHYSEEAMRWWIRGGRNSPGKVRRALSHRQTLDELKEVRAREHGWDLVILQGPRPWMHLPDELT